MKSDALNFLPTMLVSVLVEGRMEVLTNPTP